MSAIAISPRRGLLFGGLSALLHAAAVVALVFAAMRPLAPPVEQPVALVWDSTVEGASDESDSAAQPAPPAAPPTVAPPPMQAAVPAAPAAPPMPPPPIAPSPAPPAAFAAPTVPAPAVPAPPDAVALLPPPPPPAAPAPPAPPAPPVEAAMARPPPSATPPPRPAPQAAATPRVWSPPSRRTPTDEPAEAASTGGGIAIGVIAPPRPSSGGSNAAPAYPRASRIRGEQGRVTLLVQVAPDGRVADLSVLGSSGHAALDEEAQRAVRRWLFEPARQDGRAVFATLAVNVTFRLDGERRW